MNYSRNTAAFQAAFSRMGFDDLVDPRRVIVVAGTNGKGSVSAMLHALLTAAGRKVGLFTSPHLVEPMERIRVGSEDVTAEEFAEVYQQIEVETKDLSLSTFQILTLMALQFFLKKKPVDWMILEVGLGGEFDPTNSVPHLWSVITRLGLDHQAILGGTLREIAKAKFGIVSQNGTVIHAPFDESLQGLATAKKYETQSRWVEQVNHEFAVTYEERSPIFYVETKWGRARLALPGPRGAENAALAVTAFNELGFSPQENLEALSRVRFSGRMQKVDISRVPCPVYVSGDHNPQGVRSLVELLKFYPRRTIHLLIGLAKDKEYAEILTELQTIPGVQIYLTEIPGDRARSIAEYGSWSDAVNFCEKDPARGLERLATLVSKDDLVVVTGSLYLVGKILQLAFTSKSD